MDIQTLRNEYKGAILRLADKYKLENVRIFGSTVRGEARPDSDLNMLVHPRPGCSLFDIVGFECDTCDLLGGMKVDVISDRAIKELLRPYILSEAVPL
jgi:predicted nucleotidyltransferase